MALRVYRAAIWLNSSAVSPYNCSMLREVGATRSNVLQSTHAAVSQSGRATPQRTPGKPAPCVIVRLSGGQTVRMGVASRATPLGLPVAYVTGLFLKSPTGGELSDFPGV